ncbi:hypothetical protein GOP47_0021281 [Adiantum capillus-veneris]|uniref:F-box domain-containing protein n=1 Tax=Adiantum capillus-veneris TaxID=13818 RepID=A0A9D4UAU0_ADICA|nr:hypothetical protein GOP47_0021281 [Adiantum capillus-veneris]
MQGRLLNLCADRPSQSFTSRIMDMISDSSHTGKRLAPSGSSFDCFPDEVIGIILSHMPCVRDVVMASVTCHKWQEAAWNYLYRLNFIESDFVSRGTVMTRISREAIISKVVMKTKSLRELSICMYRTVSIQAVPLITWLDFTKKSLTSLTLENGIQPNLNLLDSLGGGQSKLKCFKWESPYIRTIDSIRHSFQSLVSLSLVRPSCTLSPKNLQELLCICPSLASLRLEDTHIYYQADATCQMKSCSLKALSLHGGFEGIDHVVLFMECLDLLTVEGVTFQSLKLVQERQSCLQNLTIEHANVAAWDLGESVNSLRTFNLNQGDDLAKEWPRYYQLISTVRTLQKLQLSGRMLTIHEGVNLNEIAGAFPELSQLAVNYEHAPRAFMACNSAYFKKLVILKLSANTINEPFALWIAQFLNRCASLKRLKIAGEVCEAKTRYMKSLCMFNAAIIDIMRSYPHVKVSFDFY